MLEFTADQFREEQESLNKQDRFSEEEWKQFFQHTNETIQDRMQVFPLIKDFCFRGVYSSGEQESDYQSFKNFTLTERNKFATHYKNLGFKVTGIENINEYETRSWKENERRECDLNNQNLYFIRISL